ncbi:MAG: hypothetical protein JXL97_20395 [Bacteroidales bacterium]|nr:hypothetical protein [Bacteroidales bacterium]
MKKFTYLSIAILIFVNLFLTESCKKIGDMENLPIIVNIYARDSSDLYNLENAIVEIHQTENPDSSVSTILGTTNSKGQVEKVVLLDVNSNYYITVKWRDYRETRLIPSDLLQKISTGTSDFPISIEITKEVIAIPVIVKEEIEDSFGNIIIISSENARIEVRENGNEKPNANSLTDSTGIYTYITTDLEIGDFFVANVFKSPFKNGESEIQVSEETGSEDLKLVVVLKK